LQGGKEEKKKEKRAKSFSSGLESGFRGSVSWFQFGPQHATSEACSSAIPFAPSI
jgi:hypothetical protein